MNSFKERKGTMKGKPFFTYRFCSSVDKPTCINSTQASISSINTSCNHKSCNISSMPKRFHIISGQFCLPVQQQQQHKQQKQNKIQNQHKAKHIQTFQRLLIISNIASILCVIDCTILPLLTIALPFIGETPTSTSEPNANATVRAAWLHELGHSIALYFVLPIGCLASTVNYLNHEKKSLLYLSWMGLGCVYIANAQEGGPIFTLLTLPLPLSDSVLHDLHCGTVLHRVVNIVGCVCLLLSNCLGRKVAGCRHKDCGIIYHAKTRNGKIASRVYFNVGGAKSGIGDLESQG